SKDIDAASGISPESIASLSNFTIEKAPLNRVFGVFFNQNQSVVLRDKDVRKALEDAIDRDALLAKVLGGYGTALTGPVPPSLIGSQVASTSDAASSTLVTGDLAAAAQQELIKKGWTLGSDGVLQKTTGSGKTASTERL